MSRPGQNSSKTGADDPRIERFIRSTEEMRRGRFDVRFPSEGPDAVARLGVSLNALAGTLETRFNELTKLAQITERVNIGVMLEDVLEEIYDSFRTVIPYHRLGLALLEDGDRVARAHWARSEGGEIKLVPGYSAKLAGSSLEKIIQSGEPRILNDLEAYLEKHPSSESTRLVVSEGIRSSLTCPLVALGKPIGFLFFSSREKNTYRELHQGYFLQLATQVSTILEKSRMYERMLDTNRRLRELKTALQHEASHDPLTGLWNRRAILRLLKREMARADREEHPLAAVIVDLDLFKPINDQHGHLVGDEVLKELARRLITVLRSGEFFGRMGGEEFLVMLCPGTRTTAEKVMERARLAFSERPIDTTVGELRVTISLGAAVVETPGAFEMSDVLTAADRALYSAKSAGRNRWALETLGDAAE